MSDPLDDLADDIARQSHELWAHFPPDEVDDDEPLGFKLDDDGRLVVRSESAVYYNCDDHACRARRLPHGDEVSTWRKGRMLHCGIVPYGDPTQN
jgi:hypothetical protein